jgi:hypothetical protein
LPLKLRSVDRLRKILLRSWDNTFCRNDIKNLVEPVCASGEETCRFYKESID